MRKASLVSLLFVSLFSKAQIPFTDELNDKSDFRYVGIQSNMLIAQFLSFNANAAINTNPYLFSFSRNSKTTGKGFSLGTGFNVSQSSSNDGVSSIDIRNVNVTFRMGLERKYRQRERFIPFHGLEGAFGVMWNRTRSQLNQSFNNAATTVETLKFFLGPSYRAGLMLACTKNVLIGTEFYFNAHISFATVNNGLGGSEFFGPFNIGFQTPTALFLIYRY